MKLKKIQFTPIKIFISSVFLVAFGYAGYVFYASKVLDGDVGGANAQQIAKLKNPYNPLELIKEGRLDALFALIPIMDKPIMGFGSWAEDNTGKYNLIYAKMADSKPGNERDSNLIPAHSVVLAAWLWAGLGGLIGVSILYFRIFNWGWILFSKTNSFVIILIIPLLIDQVWNFLFSPIAHLRQTAPFIFAIVLTEYYKFLVYKTKKSMIYQNVHS